MRRRRRRRRRMRRRRKRETSKIEISSASEWTKRKKENIKKNFFFVHLTMKTKKIYIQSVIKYIVNVELFQ